MLRFDLQPLPSVPPEPPPVPVDEVRDLIDWISFWLNTASLISTIIGVVAIYLAYAANKHAKAAQLDARAAERRSIKRSDLERRRVFELEILRDLIRATDERFEQLISNPLQVRVTIGTRLKMIPPDELAHWRIVASGDRRRIVQVFDPSDPPGATDGIPARHHGYVNFKQAPHRQLTEAIQAALLKDLMDAIEERMTIGEQSSTVT